MALLRGDRAEGRNGSAGRPARLALLALAPWLAVAGCKDQPAPQQQSAAPPAVLVIRAERQPIAQQAEFIGRVEAIDKLEVRARVTGFLYARHFNEGDRVKAGDLLFTVEQQPFAAEVALREANAQRAEAELRNASLQVERGRELVRTNNIPQAELDARIAAEGEAQGSLAAARAQVDQARIQYGYTEIRAAFDGRAGRSPLSPGNVVGPETGVLVTVVRDDPIRVSFPVTLRELLRVRRAGGREQHEVLVRLPDGSLMQAPGRIEFLDVTASRTTDTVMVQAVLPNPERLLTDGQAVNVLVRDAAPAEAIVIPQSALQIDQQGPFVLAIGAENRIEVKRIRTAPGPAGSVIAAEGLDAGTLIVTEGSGRVRPGQTVAPRPQEQPLRDGGAPGRAG